MKHLLKFSLMAVLLIVCSACDQREVVFKEMPSQQTNQSEQEQSELDYQFIGPKDWDGKLITWLINDVKLKPFDLNVEQINDYLEKEAVDYRVQVLLLSLAEDILKSGEDFDRQAQLIMETHNVDMLHLGYFYIVSEYDRPIIHRLMENDLLMDVTDHSFWSKELYDQERLYALGDPKIDVIGVFVPQNLDITIGPDSLMNWIVEHSNEINLNVPANKLFYNDVTFEQIFLFENNQWKYWWRTDSYQTLRQLEWGKNAPTEGVTLTDLLYLEEWDNGKATYQNQKGTFIELGIHYDLRLVESYDELESGVLTTTEYPEETTDFLSRLYNDPAMIESISNGNFEQNKSNKSFYNQWLMYDETLNDRLDQLFKEKIAHSTKKLDVEMVHQLQNKMEKSTTYQKLLRFESVEEGELRAFEEQMNEFGLEALLKEMNES